MPRTITFLNRRCDPAGNKHANGVLQLRLEQLGVIAGFLLGLLVGFVFIGQALSTLDVPSWLRFILGALVTAVFTRSGQILAMSLYKATHLDQNING